jgi:hypothetical protein
MDGWLETATDSALAEPPCALIDTSTERNPMLEAEDFAATPNFLEQMPNAEEASSTIETKISTYLPCPRVL